MEEENMPEIRAHKRIHIGRTMALTGIIMYALIRALIRATETPPPGTVEWLVTYGGQISWAWATAWVIVAGLCVSDMIRRRAAYGPASLIGMCIAWGTAHLGQWAYYGFGGYGWINALEWYMPALLVAGGLIVVTGLYDLARGRP